MMHTGGCAPDLFWLVFTAGRSIRVESICPTTGTAIRVALSPEGVELVEPPGAVVTMLNPRTPAIQEVDHREPPSIGPGVRTTGVGIDPLPVLSVLDHEEPFEQR
jgi:Alkylmercury lyase